MRWSFDSCHSCSKSKTTETRATTNLIPQLPTLSNRKTGQHLVSQRTNLPFPTHHHPIKSGVVPRSKFLLGW